MFAPLIHLLVNFAHCGDLGFSAEQQFKQERSPFTLNILSVLRTAPAAAVGKRRPCLCHLRTSLGSSGESYQRWRQGIYRSIEATLSFEGVGLNVERQCQLAEVSRAAFIAVCTTPPPHRPTYCCAHACKKLALENRRLQGYRLVTETLRREGHLVNHKRVLRLMREDNLLSLRRTKYVFTTDSRHDLPVYPNLARRVALTAPNQLWVADTTYIRLRNEFIYLAVVWMLTHDA
jgi:HTH-like domain